MVLNAGCDSHVPAEIAARPGQRETMGQEIPILGHEEHDLGFIPPGLGPEYIHSKVHLFPIRADLAAKTSRSTWAAPLNR